MRASLFAQLRTGSLAGPGGTLILPGRRLLPYSGLWRRVEGIAGHLRSRGLGVGDRVLVQVEKSPTALALYLACLRQGLVQIPLNTAYTMAELAYFLGDAEPSLVVCDPSRRAAVAALAPGIPIETLDAEGRCTLAEPLDADPGEPVPYGKDAPAAILYTSGTTGRAKGAVLSQENLLSNALTLRDLWRFGPEDVLLHALPIFHAHGLFVGVHVALLSGASMIFLPRFDASEVLALLPDATAMMGVPTFYGRLLEQDGLADAVRGMRLFVSGSAPLSAETHRRFQERTGHWILERYGMTETGMIASNPYEGPRRGGTVGHPLPGTRLRVADAEGRPVAPGEAGQIEVAGPNVFTGYWRQPEKTAEAFRPDGFFITGDLGRIDPEGYLQILGRDRDLIITGGFNVYPKEVEDALNALPGVAESAVIGLPHADFGEAVTAVVVPEPGCRLEEPALLAPLRDVLAKFKLPKRVLVAETLPRNAMGKVQKAALRERHAALYT